MKITPVEFDLTSYLQDKFGHAERSEGLHLSRIYGDLDRAIQKPKSNDFTDDDLNEFAQVGFLWERVLETTLADIAFSATPERYCRIGELTSTEGVVMTPDYLDLDFRGDGSYQHGLEEWKATWRSVKNAENLERNHWKWLVQIKGYCKELGTPYARLRAVYLVGDWRSRIVPTPKMWEMEFTSRELKENWEMLMGHARRKGWM
jgi:hypothetical protein